MRFKGKYEVRGMGIHCRATYTIWLANELSYKEFEQYILDNLWVPIWDKATKPKGWVYFEKELQNELAVKKQPHCKEPCYYGVIDFTTASHPVKFVFTKGQE